MANHGRYTTMTTKPNTKPTPAESKANEPKATLATGITLTMQAITDMIPTVVNAADAAYDARKAAEGVADEGRNKRVVLISDFADLAIANNLSDAHITEGVKLAIEAYSATKNAKASSLTQFRSELLRGSHTKARTTIRADFATAYAMWKAERDAEADDPEAPTPLKHAFDRAYHMVVGTTGIAAARIGEAKGFKNMQAEAAMLADSPLSLAEHVIEARGIDPDLAEKALKRCIAQITEVAETFPHHRFATVIEYLGKLPSAELQAAYEKANGIAPKAKPAKAKAKAKASKPAAPKPDLSDESVAEAADGLIS